MARTEWPNLFIVGAPKCGTTAMTAYLAQHPDVFFPAAKDTHFFGSDLHFKNNVAHPGDLFRVPEQLYRSWYRGRAEKYRGDASVFYLASESAPSEIAAAAPDARIVIMLRDPVDMLHSLHRHFLWDRNEVIDDFEQAVAAEPDRRQGRRIPDSAYLEEGLHYLRVASYADQVSRYLNTFGPDRVHVVMFEDFRSDTRKAYRRVLEFLDVDPTFAPSIEVINAAREVRSKALHRFFYSPPRWLRPVAERLSLVGWIRWPLRRALDLLNTRAPSATTRSPATDERIRQALDADIGRLEQVLEVDLSAWRIPDPAREVANGQAPRPGARSPAG